MQREFPSGISGYAASASGSNTRDNTIGSSSNRTNDSAHNTGAATSTPASSTPMQNTSLPPTFPPELRTPRHTLQTRLQEVEARINISHQAHSAATTLWTGLAMAQYELALHVFSHAMATRGNMENNPIAWELGRDVENARRRMEERKTQLHTLEQERERILAQLRWMEEMEGLEAGMANMEVGYGGMDEMS